MHEERKVGDTYETIKGWWCWRGPRARPLGPYKFQAQAIAAGEIEQEKQAGRWGKRLAGAKRKAA